MSAMNFNESHVCYEGLHTAYSEKHRFYHTVNHIDAMLQHFDAVKDIAEKPAELELAIWFHDGVYKALSKSNEFDSAVWAKDFCLSCGYDVAGAERVFSLIMTTLHNGETQLNGVDQQLIVDFDLTILGASPDVYDEYERNIRKEYRMVPSFIYRKKRKELLRSFLNDDSLYCLDYFKDKFEVTARQNISRAIEML